MKISRHKNPFSFKNWISLQKKIYKRDLVTWHFEGEFLVAYWR